MSNSIVLLSAGIDSVVNLAEAMQRGSVILALTFDYGQHSAPREIERAQKIATYYKLSHKVVSLPWMRDCVYSCLLQDEEGIPDLKLSDLDDREKVAATARAVWIPNRNAVFINIAASFAEGLKVPIVVAGFNAEEGEAFPDNSLQFIEACNQLFRYSTLEKVMVISYTSNMNKEEIVRRAVELSVPWEYIWSCYLGREEMCGSCKSCCRLKRALLNTGCYEVFVPRKIRFSR